MYNILYFESVDEIFKVTMHVNAAEAIAQYFPVVLLITLYKVVLSFESVYEVVTIHNGSNFWVWVKFLIGNI